MGNPKTLVEYEQRDQSKRVFLSRCQRLRACGFAPNCVCDVDPTDPRDVAEWRKDSGA